ncbi:MAG TPA: MlaD family protein [Solirubrobacteraceae bacterium]|jgi:phospholipid/cholesterol/gamma-HCH transport system substrate-binding protein|nr:MlaD family protein [Solirubrobacteraceae bacterium]
MPSAVYGRSLPRLAGLAALVIAGIALLIVILTPGGSAYTINAEFTDAGQIVAGDLVEVGGLGVGSVQAVKLTPHGLADLVLEISDPSFVPLHQGTVAAVALPALAGEANRVIALQPGPRRAGRIPDGGVLPAADTRGAVDLDVLLDTLDPGTRRSLQLLIAQGARAVARPADTQFNRGLRYLNPALSQTTSFGRQLLSDRAALSELVSTTASLAGALAAKRNDLTSAVSSTARTLTQVSDQAGALGDALARAPAVFTQTRQVLDDTNYALKQLDPTLEALQPTAKPAAMLLRHVYPVVNDALPTVTAINALLPDAERALNAMIPVAREAVPALQSITSGIGPLLPVVAGLRPFMPDLIGGFFDGVAANNGGTYDANGHYLRVSPSVGQGGGLTGLLPPLQPLPVLAPRTGLTDRCPGGATAPAPDGSNPWVPPGSHICNPKQDVAGP